MKFRVKKHSESPNTKASTPAAEFANNNERVKQPSSTSFGRVLSSSSSAPNFNVEDLGPGHSSGSPAADAVTLDWQFPAPSSPSPVRTTLRQSASAPCLVSLQSFLKYIAERGRRFADRQRWRLVMKDGSCNVSSVNITKRKRKYLFDLFTTAVDMKWRFILLTFALAFVVSWTVFALFWWLLAYANGDCTREDEEAALATDTDNNRGPCVANVYDFWTALLFSIETQHTIGYGYRVIEPKCTTAILLLMLQSCVGVFIQCLITGIVFSKLSRPKSRAQTIMFSRHAVICRRERRHCLLFRVGDMRKSHIIGTSIRAMIVRDRVTSEGECIPLCQAPLKVETEMGGPGDAFAFLVWPVTVTHVIDEESPLWEISAEQLISAHFEIIIMLEGTVESNGKLTQVRTSYLPSEILWGHRLMPLLTYQTTKGTYEIDYKHFNSTIPFMMTEQSAKSESELSNADGNGYQPLQKTFYQNTEKDSSLSLVRCQGIGQPMEVSTNRRLFKRFRPSVYNTAHA